jgi:hypothetical protein
MLRSAVLHSGRGYIDGRRSGAAWAAAVAILFAAIAIASFAVDLSLSLSGPGPELQHVGSSRH